MDLFHHIRRMYDVIICKQLFACEIIGQIENSTLHLLGTYSRKKGEGKLATP